MYNYFEIDKSTTLQDVKQQYRKLSMKFHPDRLNGSTEQFREVNEEYKRALHEIQDQAKNVGNSNLYKLINEQLVSIDSLINKINVPKQFKPAICYLLELGVNKLGDAIIQKQHKKGQV